MMTPAEPTLERAATEALQKDVVARFKRLETQHTEPLNAKSALRLAADACRDVLAERWAATQRTDARRGAKAPCRRVHYLSMEFLMGRALGNALAALGMQGSLNRLSPFIATLLAQLRSQYGLDVDASLRGMDVRLLEQTGDSARLRLRYTLAGQPIDAIVPVVRIDGHWYLADFVRRAEASLAIEPGEAGGKNAASP